MNQTAPHLLAPRFDWLFSVQAHWPFRSFEVWGGGAWQLPIRREGEGGSTSWWPGHRTNNGPCSCTCSTTNSTKCPDTRRSIGDDVFHEYESQILFTAIECCIIIDLCVVQCVAEVVPSFLPLAAQFGLSKNSHMTFMINPSSLRKRWVSHVGKAAFRCDVLLNVPLTLGFAWTSTPSPQTNNATSSSPQCVVEVIGSKPISRRADPPPVRCQTDGLCCPQTDGGKGDVVSRPRERSHLHHFTCRHQRWTMAQRKSVIWVMSHNRVPFLTSRWTVPGLCFRWVLRSAAALSHWL